jgi:hypothetical protein
MGSFLDRIKATKFRVEEVSIPEWGNDVYVREMSSGDRDLFEAQQTEAKGLAKYQNFRARIVCACVCDAAGNRLFADTDVGEIAKLPHGPVGTAFDAACRLNGLLEDNVKALEKN